MASEPQNVKDIFLAAVEKASPEERATYLDQACEGMPGLRRRVEALIAGHENPGNLLDKPAVAAKGAIDPQATVEMPPITERPGAVIDRYKLMEQIGEGGMAVVYVAEQLEPVRRKVALKIIKPGMDTKEVIARFEAEKQVLALMDHPNIARVLDAGATQSGRPYFVMELVRGISITDYCDQNNLTTQQRLDLFGHVCMAVQHAHQKGIIHRDIKPSNVLVTLHDGVPVPKVIDFGVAKAINQRLTERTIYTRFSQMIGTPLYMSPEQAEMSGLDVDTRSDIYSLGVLLYELLTGVTPFAPERLREATYEELLRIIREEEPPRPSTRVTTLGETASTISVHRKTEPKKLGQLLRGDLDWIVMKALEKDRTRRYETANGFAADVRRYLSDEPVLASPPSAAYRFRKFARRNKALLTTTALVATVLVLGIVISSSLAIWAIGAEHLAEERLAAEKQAHEETDLARAGEAEQRIAALKAKKAAETEAAKATTIADLLQQMLRSADPTSGKGPDYTVRELLDEFSATLGNRSMLKDRPEIEAAVRLTIGSAYGGLGLREKARVHLEATLRLRREIFASEHENVTEALLACAWNWHDLGDRARAEELAREAVNNCRQRPDRIDALLGSLQALQHFLNMQRKLGEADTVGREALEIAQADGATDQLAVAGVLHSLSWSKSAQHDFNEAESLARRAIELQRKTWGNERPAGHGWALMRLAEAEQALEKLHLAETHFREGLAVFFKYYDSSHATVQYALRRLRSVLEAQGDQEGLKGLDLIRNDDRFLEGHNLTRLAEHYQPWVEKLIQEDRLLDAVEELRHLEVPGSDYVLFEVARIYSQLRQGNKVLATAEKEVAVLEAIACRADAVADHRWALAQAYAALADIQWANGKTLDAEANYQKGLETQRQLVNEFSTLAEYRSDLGEISGISERGRTMRSAAYVDYRIKISSPGDYQLYLRWDAHDSSSNSLYAHLLELADGPGGEAADWYSPSCSNRDADFETDPWKGTGGIEANREPLQKVPTVWSVPAPGDYTVRLAMREDGAAVDAFVLQLADLPAPVDDGPAESQRSEDGVFLETNGRVVVEAEHFASRTSVSDERNWSIIPTEGPGDEIHLNYRGSAYIQALPDKDPTWTDRFHERVQSEPTTARGCNDTAWRLVTHRDPQFWDPKRAVELAEEATQRKPNDWSYTNTLGTAYYRAGQFQQAIDPLNKSNELSKGRIFSSNAFFLAMAHWELSEREQARKWYIPAVLWMNINDPLNVELNRFRSEAATLLGLPEELPEELERARADESRLYTLILEMDPEAAWAYMQRGGILALQGNRKNVLEDCSKAIELDPEDPVIRYQSALAQLGAGNLDEYRSACTQMAEHFAQAEEAATANWVAWTCVLGPDALSDLSLPVKRAEEAVAQRPDDQMYLNTLGAALYRAGRYEEAARRLVTAQVGSGPGRHSPAYTWFFLAMAHHRLGHDEEAKKWLDKATEWTDMVTREDRFSTKLSWNRRLTLEVLRKEAESLLTGSDSRSDSENSTPALEGTEPPTRKTPEKKPSPNTEKPIPPV